jgi:hypothetical protein
LRGARRCLRWSGRRCRRRGRRPHLLGLSDARRDVVLRAGRGAVGVTVLDALAASPLRPSLERGLHQRIARAHTSTRSRALLQ